MIPECIDKILGFFEKLGDTLSRIEIGGIGLFYILVAALIIIMVIAFIFNR